jgi:Tol biopolymer transport system component
LSFLQMLGADGSSRRLSESPGAYQWPRVSPDGRQVAFTTQDAGNFDLWLLDVQSGSRRRLLTEGADVGAPVWMPDGRAILYGAPDGIRWTSQDGGRKGLLMSIGTRSLLLPRSVSADGSLLAFAAVEGPEQKQDTHYDLWTAPISGAAPELKLGTPIVFRRTEFTEAQPTLFPDSKWMAHTSEETGKFVAYVRTVPDDGRQWELMGGARIPVWSPATGEILLRTEDQLLFAVPYRISGKDFSVGRSRQWSSVRLADTGIAGNVDIFPDGRHVAALVPVEESPADRNQVVIVTGLAGEIERRLASAGNGAAVP